MLGFGAGWQARRACTASTASTVNPSTRCRPADVLACLASSPTSFRAGWIMQAASMAASLLGDRPVACQKQDGRPHPANSPARTHAGWGGSADCSGPQQLKRMDPSQGELSSLRS